MSASLRLSLAKCKRILTTLSSMAAVNALSFKDCPGKKVRTLITGDRCKTYLPKILVSHTDCLHPLRVTGNPPSLHGFAQGESEIQSSTIDNGCVLITRTILKHAFLLTKASPKPTVVASTNAYGSKRKTTSSSWKQLQVHMDKEWYNILTKGWSNHSFHNQNWNRFGKTGYCCFLVFLHNFLYN